MKKPINPRPIIKPEYIGEPKFRIREITNAADKTIFIAEKQGKFWFWKYWEKIYLIDEYRSQAGWGTTSTFNTKEEAEQQIEQFKEFIKQNKLSNQTTEIIYEYK